MTDDPRVEAMMDDYHGGRDWRYNWLESNITVEKERMARALAAADRVQTPKPDFPPWSREIGILVMALGAAVSGMAMKSDKNQELRWPNGERQLKSGATTATMLDDFLRAAFPETPDAG